MSENDGIEKNSFEHETKSSHYPSLTEQQIKDEIDDLHKVYPIVRLVNKNKLKRVRVFCLMVIIRCAVEKHVPSF